jgi:hypothetical protein
MPEGIGYGPVEETGFVFDPPGEGNHSDFVKGVIERWEFYRDQRRDVIQGSLEKKREFRTTGEEWRANLALPDAYANIQSKVANLVSIILSADPVVQPEAVHDKDLETAKSVERLIDYSYRKNHFTKLLAKMVLQQRVAGTAFYKMTWTEQAHTFTMSRTPEAMKEFNERLQEQLQNPQIGITPPNWMEEPEEFEKFRTIVNDAGVGKIPAPPLDGPQRIIQYRGPKIHLLPMSSVYLDPLNDEMETQNFVVYRTVKPLQWLVEQVGKGRYDEAAVAYAMDGWDGQVKEEEEVELAIKMGINADASASADPYYAKGVELLEVWQPGTEVPYAIILNRKAVINVKPGEMPFIHGEMAIGTARATVVPGHFYGTSDLRPTRDVFWEKRKLRNLRVDAVTLNVLPAFAKLKEVGLPEMMHKIRPGALIPVSRTDAIKSLIREPLPPEAYKEPAELDADIADSMGVYASTKGAPATIGRVTGTEFQGRENRTQIRFKLDSLFLEEDLAPINRQMLGLWAQFSPDPLTVKVGGNPNPLLNISRNELMEAMEQQWRFRGANKAINRDMQVQQLLMWTKTFGAQLTPTEFRFAAKLILELEDIRGTERLISDSGTQMKEQEYQQAAQAQASGENPEEAAAAEEAPAEAGASEQAAMEGGEEG